MSGPLFLLVYAALGIAAIVWLLRHTRAREAEQPARFLEFAQDPYQVAYLRAGSGAAARLAMFALLDRGLLEEAGGRLRRARNDAGEFVRRPIEHAVLACCADWQKTSAVERDTGVQRACQGFHAALAGAALLAGEATYAARLKPCLAAAAVLLGVAVARIGWALAHGRHNVGFLIVFAAIGVAALIGVWRRRRSGLGDAALERLERLFAGLKLRADQLLPGGQSHEAALAAALFGFGVLPAERFPYVRRLFRGNDAGGGDGGCDAGDSSDGGGCGGGCGGCGG